MPNESTAGRIIVALDFADAASALALVERLPTACKLKVGLELYTAAGPLFVTTLVTRGFDVFLDLKFHDIPRTVARTCARAADLGVWMLNVHALGGPRMLSAARAAMGHAATRPRLLAVTLLTSHGDTDLRAIGLGDDSDASVSRLAQLAAEAGLDGVVCSGREAQLLRRAHGPKFMLVTPGIRSASVVGDDQMRTLTPAEAVAAGADYLVIGRPITAAADPLVALDAVVQQLTAACDFP